MTNTQAVEAAVQRLINQHFYPDMRPDFQHYMAFAKDVETALRAELSRPQEVASALEFINNEIPSDFDTEGPDAAILLAFSGEEVKSIRRALATTQKV